MFLNWLLKQSVLIFFSLFQRNSVMKPKPLFGNLNLNKGNNSNVFCDCSFFLIVITLETFTQPGVFVYLIVSMKRYLEYYCCVTPTSFKVLRQFQLDNVLFNLLKTYLRTITWETTNGMFKNNMIREKMAEMSLKAKRFNIFFFFSKKLKWWNGNHYLVI